ncbi:MarR family transcriptional regulator [Lentzea alba]|uniref:MarR family transcriptional regulator n=1 Tax=Lentzea alba TaxID=2714351 RepID=UPI0039BEE8F2
MSTARTTGDLVVQLQLLSRDVELLAAQRLEGTTPRAVTVLTCADEGEKTQGEIAGRACLDKSAMVHLVDALEKDGLATQSVAKGPSRPGRQRDRRGPRAGRRHLGGAR